MGLKVSNPSGGQSCPISIIGEIPEWKNVQKKETKKRTSEVINKIIPTFKERITKSEWRPCRKDSREISRHQQILKTTKIKKEEKSNVIKCNKNTKVKKRLNERREEINGQGLISTKWNLVKLVIIWKILNTVKRIT